jgi:RsmE family RNA methyltransferase
MLAIGTERGWTEKEMKLFSDFGFNAATLGDRILKTETAAIAAVSVILSGLNYL